MNESTGQMPLAKPDLSGRESELVAEVIASGRLSLGPMQDRFEREFAAWLGVDDAVAVSSGTAALHLCVRALGWSDGDRVVTTPFTFVASANSLLYEGVEPVFVDVDPITLCIDPDQIESHLDPATVGILPVHIFGWPAAMPEIEKIASARDLGILEDACQALGSVCSDGRMVGARGNASIFAFYANKQLTTGEGGMVIPADRKAAELARSERNQGRAADMDTVDHERLGFNYRLSEIASAIGVAQMERLDYLLTERKRVADLYAETMRGIGGAPAGEGDFDGLVLPCTDRGKEHRSWFVYPVRIPTGIDVVAVARALTDDGVSAKPYLPCVHLLPDYRERFGSREGLCPNAEDASRRSLALPFHGGMQQEDVERAVSTLARVLERGVGEG
jgi:perosamine synthetase